MGVIWGQLVCVACAVWMMGVLLVEATPFRSYVSENKNALPIIALALPTLVAGTVASLCMASGGGSGWPRMQRRSSSRLLLEPNWAMWSWYGVALPILGFAFLTILRHAQNNESFGQYQWLIYTGNALGMTGVAALSVLLVPVARQNVILKLFGWSEASAMCLHRWTGRLVLMLVLLHGGCHVLFWMTQGKNLSKHMLPSSQCFDPFQHHRHHSSCYEPIRNFSGCIALFGLVLIGLSSCIRRSHYRVFCHIHVLAGPTVFCCTIVHWNRSMLYMAGGAIYYTACSFPGFWKRFQQPPTRLVSVQPIDDGGERPCVALTFAATDSALRKFRPGLYVNVSVPVVSNLSHPFTVNRTGEHLQVIFRCTGPFTNALAKRLVTENARPDVFVSGYHGCAHRIQQLAQHDVVVLIAGGIGVTTYLSLLQQLKGSGRTHKVVLHWICREPQLIQFVKHHYLAKVSSEVTLEIVIHWTEADCELSIGDIENNTILSTAAVDCESVSSTATVPFSNARVSGVTFFFIAWLSLWGIWLIHQQIGELSTLSRLYSPLFVVLVGMVVSYVAHRLLRSTKKQEWMVIDDDSVVVNETTALSTTPTIHRTTFVERRGRPAMADLLEETETAESPAVFACGPRRLLADIRGATACVLYEESFEL